ncbi:hypothetical protein GCM10020258_04770 [Sphingomonas yabuuchiae]
MPAVVEMTGNPPRKDVRRPDPIVAVGLLTQRDLDVLGSGFRRSFPVEEDTAFDDLLQALDRSRRFTCRIGRTDGPGISAKSD